MPYVPTEDDRQLFEICSDGYAKLGPIAKSFHIAKSKLIEWLKQDEEITPVEYQGKPRYLLYETLLCVSWNHTSSVQKRRAKKLVRRCPLTKPAEVLQPDKTERDVYGVREIAAAYKRLVDSGWFAAMEKLERERYLETHDVFYEHHDIFYKWDEERGTFVPDLRAMGAVNPRHKFPSLALEEVKRQARRGWAPCGNGWRRRKSNAA
jgi:hypothetical protein